MASGCVRVDSTKKKTKQKSGGSGLAFLSVTSHLILGNALYWGAVTKGGVVSCSTSNKDPKYALFFVAAPQLRLERQP